jgi:hypothetical protein
MKRPLFVIVSTFITGIVLATHWGPVPFYLPLLFLAAALSLLLFFRWHRESLGAFCILGLIFFLLGFLDMGIYRWQVPDEGHVASLVGQEKISAEGVVCEEPRRSPDKTDVMVRVFKVYEKDGKVVYRHGKCLLGVRPSLPFNMGMWSDFDPDFDPA